MTRLVVPDRSPCPYCENDAGRYAWHGPPAVIVEDDTTIAFLAPAALGGLPGHTLVRPRRHAETIFDLTDSEMAAVGIAVKRAAVAIRAVYDPEGLLVQQHNGIAAFQTLPHVHVHVIPKRANAPFPPVENIPITPYEERTLQAALLREAWEV